MSLKTVEILSQGNVEVEGVGRVFGNIGAENIVLEINLGTKRCDVLAYGVSDGAPMIALAANEGSVDVADGKGSTDISFPQLKGYRAVAAENAKHEVWVAFVSEQAMYSKI